MVLIMLGDFGVEVPAIIIEADGGIGNQRLHIGGGFVLEVIEPDHYVGNLNAGVIDVVMHFHLMTGGAQHADKGVAQDRVAQVTDVRSLIRVDIGVLDDDLLAGALGFDAFAMQQGDAVCATVEPDVDVAVAGDFHRGDAGNGSDFPDELGRDLLRGLAELFGELEGGGDGELAEIALPRLFDRDLKIYAVTGLNMRVESAGELLFNGMEHEELRV